MPKFKAGDKVQLVSGGPVMAVRGYSDSEANVTWFDNKQVVQYASFPDELLTAADSGPGFASVKLTRT